MPKNSHFLICVALLIVSTIFGGGGSPSPVPELIVELAALMALGAWCLTPKAHNNGPVDRPLWIGTAIFVALPIIQLIPPAAHIVARTSRQRIRNCCAEPDRTGRQLATDFDIPLPYARFGIVTDSPDNIVIFRITGLASGARAPSGCGGRSGNMRSIGRGAAGCKRRSTLVFALSATDFRFCHGLSSQQKRRGRCAAHRSCRAFRLCRNPTRPHRHRAG